MFQFKAYYRSMTAFYSLGSVFADDEQQALKIARNKYGGAFSDGEKRLIAVQRAVHESTD